ncbi:cytochrome c family protein [bacterium]|nr:cytochrome c family protein [bacterium]
MKKLYMLAAFIFTTTLINGQLVKPNHSKDRTLANSQMNDYCRTCHTCENPTRFNPCFEQCARHGAQFSSNKSFEAGPDIVILDKLIKLYKPVIFSHKLHASMSEMSGGCTHCHHYSDKSGEIPACNKCHDEKADFTNLNEPSLKGAYHRQCLGCHREWGHENACQFCHQEIGLSDERVSTYDKTDIVGVPHPLIKAEQKYVYQTPYKQGPVVTFHHTDHVDLFGLKCTDCHKGDNCSLCHDTVKREEKVVKHVETCGKCHTEDNCNFCHSTKEKPAFNHSISTGFVLGHYHQDVDCNNCHQSVSNFVRPSTNCTDCHIHWAVGTFDHSVTGLTLNEYHEEEDCENCHIDRDFRVEPTCDNCHDDINYPEYIPGDRLSK